MQKAQGFALHDGVLCRPGFFPRAFVTGSDYRIDGGVHRFDAIDTGLEQVDGREFPGADQTPRLDVGKIKGIGNRSVPSSFIVLVVVILPDPNKAQP